MFWQDLELLYAESFEKSGTLASDFLRYSEANLSLKKVLFNLNLTLLNGFIAFCEYVTFNVTKISLRDSAPYEPWNLDSESQDWRKSEKVLSGN